MSPLDARVLVHLSNGVKVRLRPYLPLLRHPRSKEWIEVKAQQRGMEVGLEYAEALGLVRWFDFEESLS